MTPREMLESVRDRYDAVMKPVPHAKQAITMISCIYVGVDADLMSNKFKERAEELSAVFLKISSSYVREIYIDNWIEEVIGFITGDALYIPSFLLAMTKCVN